MMPPKLPLSMLLRLPKQPRLAPLPLVTLVS
jgi:hypothetical protein